MTTCRTEGVRHVDKKPHERINFQGFLQQCALYLSTFRKKLSVSSIGTKIQADSCSRTPGCPKSWRYEALLKMGVMRVMDRKGMRIGRLVPSLYKAQGHFGTSGLCHSAKLAHCFSLI